MPSVSFVAQRGSICTVLHASDANEIRVRIGNEELTAADLARITTAIGEIAAARTEAARPLPQQRGRLPR